EVSYVESRNVKPGDGKPVVADVNGVRVGLSICFDLRFPRLYRALVEEGAQVLFVPSAFTVPTGRDHWEILLRARAIENQAFVLAPGQWGLHEGVRTTYGRSLIIDPWGTVLAQVPDGGRIAVADLDFNRLAEIRAKMVLTPRC
ncbi:MAG: carbon-nitrogen hydrolase family protein, partial [Myxococcales bacterium]|nr:carbon-nitrogen hydrolase family protein [Myxococcales bacterium]